jgi:hypothetical protein
MSNVIIFFVGFLGKNWWIITKINFSAPKMTGIAMPAPSECENQENLTFLKDFRVPSMTPKLVPSNVSGLNLIDIDSSHHLSPNTDQGRQERKNVEDLAILKDFRVPWLHNWFLSKLLG